MISCRGEVIVVHRSYAREDFIYNPLHYLQLLEQKPNAIDQAAPLVEDALKLGAISVDAVKHLVLCRMERKPPKLNMESYPYLPRTEVALTQARDHLALLNQASLKATEVVQ